ncbi:MAG TPA: DUF2784 domain-containing protein [Ramlibacter sp.]|jgi:hypothetical protein|uniref:DUF2784 domain-containing protein n=1 Tax=Ramlibacter sp. TaxID=1917967 RepID=UPI002D57AF86|nr:DUF2784 domain-containing protein [Ramlibacter sp.]HZY19596.1 DUF2784 domain-containing protein [Ramlibacter sp.]
MRLDLLADAVLVLHAGVVLFVVGGLVLVLWGNRRGWAWVNRWWFRALHLAAIAFVVLQSWLGATCPLTTLEASLRLRAGQPVSGEGFIAHWVRAVLFWQAPEWLFTTAYTVFGLAVLASWLVFPPRRRGRTAAPGDPLSR